MSEIKKKKRIGIRQILSFAFSLLIGVACGFLISASVDRTISEDAPYYVRLLIIAVHVMEMLLATYVQLIIHESGHLVFGLMSGYRFSSFRIASFMWVKESGRIRFKRFSVAGTGGQCLMVPPDMKDGKIPVVLYNLGGTMMNAITSVLFLGLFFATASIPFLATSMLFLAAVGLILAITNGVPMRTGVIDNDGYNAYALARNSEAMRAFWVQLKVNEQIAAGVRLKDMPEEWFEVPSDEAMKNSMVSVVGVFACNRLMDEERFAEADELMARMLKRELGTAGLHRFMLVCDRAFVEMIAENRKEVLDRMFSKEQKQFMNQMKGFLGVIRTEYAYALFYERDMAKAEAIRARFENRAKSYPYPIDVVSERELMDIAERKASEI